METVHGSLIPPKAPLNERIDEIWTFDKNKGRVIILDGDVYYSPNCARTVELPPIDKDEFQGMSKNIFGSKDVRAQMYHNPRWWSRAFGWASFVPIFPSYTGSLFGRLSDVPTALSTHYKDRVDLGFSLPEATQHSWMRLEGNLSSASSFIAKEYSLAAVRPFSPWAFGYTKKKNKHSVAVGQAFRSRDWFSIWIGLMSYLIAEAESVKRYSWQKDWVSLLLDHGFDQNWVDSLLSSTVCDFTAARAGVFVHLTGNSIDANQPSVAWFCRYNVPVWYRWGQAEIHSPRCAAYGPLQHQMQEAVSTSTLRLSTIIPPNTNALRDRDSEPPRAYITWFADRKERNKRRLLTETPAQRQTRLNRERQPPTVSAKVFVWEPSVSNSKIWIRTPVLKADREDTLEEYSGLQARYDSFTNEWDCCTEFGPDADENFPSMDGSEEMDDPLEQPAPPYHDSRSSQVLTRALTPPPRPAQTYDAERLEMPHLHPIQVSISLGGETSTSMPSPTTKADALQQEILEILGLYYGFTPPLPLPSSISAPLTENEYKRMVRVLGLQWSDCKDCIAFVPIVPIAKAYLDGIMNNVRPSDDKCDFNVRSRVSVASTSRLRFLRVIHLEDDKTKPLYMFDFQEQSTAPWKLALTTAANALMVCRMDRRLGEYDIGRYLLTHGVPFHTLMSSEVVDRGPREPPPPCVIPVRSLTAQFTTKDYDAYVSQRSAIVKQPRARAAVLRGGFTWRLFIMTLSIESVLDGPTGWNPMPGTMLVARDHKTNEMFVDDKLTDVELNLICGAYTCYTAIPDQTAIRSWYPTASTFDAGGENYRHWNAYSETGFIKRLDEINNPQRAATSRGPLGAAKWRDLMRGLKDVRRLTENIERWSHEFILQHTDRATEEHSV